jgi:hypothetical protein
MTPPPPFPLCPPRTFRSLFFILSLLYILFAVNQILQFRQVGGLDSSKGFVGQLGLGGGGAGRGRLR